MTAVKPETRRGKKEKAASTKATKALNEAGRRIQAFGRLTNDPAAREAYLNALRVIVEVRDHGRQDIN